MSNFSDSAVVRDARNLAEFAHRGQTRKSSSEPYVNHTIRVAAMVANVPGATAEMAAASHLHDTLEDTKLSADSILLLCGSAVLELVYALTDVYTKDAYPQMNRAARKRLEMRRIAQTCREAQIIKMADIADNLESIDPTDGFAPVFLREKEELLSLLPEDLPLRDRVERAASALRSEIKTAKAK